MVNDLPFFLNIIKRLAVFHFFLRAFNVNAWLLHCFSYTLHDFFIVINKDGFNLKIHHVLGKFFFSRLLVLLNGFLAL